MSSKLAAAEAAAEALLSSASPDVLKTSSLALHRIDPLDLADDGRDIIRALSGHLLDGTAPLARLRTAVRDAVAYLDSGSDTPAYQEERWQVGRLFSDAPRRSRPLPRDALRTS